MAGGGGRQGQCQAAWVPPAPLPGYPPARGAPLGRGRRGRGGGPSSPKPAAAAGEGPAPGDPAVAAGAGPAACVCFRLRGLTVGVAPGGAPRQWRWGETVGRGAQPGAPVQRGVGDGAGHGAHPSALLYRTSVGVGERCQSAFPAVGVGGSSHKRRRRRVGRNTTLTRVRSIWLSGVAHYRRMPTAAAARGGGARLRRRVADCTVVPDGRPPTRGGGRPRRPPAVKSAVARSTAAGGGGGEGRGRGAPSGDTAAGRAVAVWWQRPPAPNAVRPRRHTPWSAPAGTTGRSRGAHCRAARKPSTKSGMERPTLQLTGLPTKRPTDTGGNRKGRKQREWERGLASAVP